MKNMVSKMVPVLLIIVSYNQSFSQGYHRGPEAGRPLRVGTKIEGEPFEGTILSSRTAIGPGDSIGYTTFDYGTNGGACHNIILFDDEAVAIARMAQDDDFISGRRTYYTFTADGGSTWLPFSGIEASRSGWGNIDELPAAGGVEVVTSHSDNRWNVDAARGAGVWTESISDSASRYWPRLATHEASFYLHSIASVQGSGPLSEDLRYSRSPDAGYSFDVVDDPRIFTSGQNDADAYDIVTHGVNVYVAVAPAFDGTPGVGGPDVILSTSTNLGDSWTQQIIYDSPDLGELADGDETFVPDGSCSLVIDNDGQPHLFWSNYLAVGNPDGSYSLYLSVDAPIYHWSESTGITVVAYPDDNTDIGPPPGRDGNYATQPDAGVWPDVGIIVLFQGMIDEVDVNGNYYEHVYGTASVDGGLSWVYPTDVTPGTGFDASFASLSPTIRDVFAPFVYNCDDLAGNSVFGNHVVNRTAVMYHTIDLRIPLMSTGNDDLPSNPSEFQLQHNYPNPFNPISNFQFRIGNLSDVRLTIYDLLGQEVATLVNDRLAPGSYSRQWDAAGQPSGVYFYRMRAGEFVETKKLMLVR